MGTRTGLVPCCFVGEGCADSAEWVLVGPITPPSEWLALAGFAIDKPVEGAGMFARSYPCNRHLTEARGWFVDPEVLPFRHREVAEEMLDQVLDVGTEAVTLRAVS